MSYLSGMVIPVRDWKPGHDHVGVADGLDLVDIVVFNNRIEAGVEIIEKHHHLTMKNSAFT